MTDRTSFLKSIAAEPEDDTPRLIFADWLDDNGEGDHDTATAEFIRLSCSLDAKKARQTPHEGAWLDEHWSRLLPVLDGWVLHRRGGRVLHLNQQVQFESPNIVRSEPPRLIRFTKWLIATFWRGFCVSCWTYQTRDLDALGAVAPYLPLAILSIQDVFSVDDIGTHIYAAALQNARIPNDVFNRIAGFDHATITTKTFENHEPHSLPAQQRAQHSLSDAIREWAVTAQSGGLD